MKMGTRRSGIVQEREDGFLKRFLATWPPELPTRFAGLGFSSRVPGAPWRRAPGRLRRDTPSVFGWSRSFPHASRGHSGACAPSGRALPAREPPGGWEPEVLIGAFQSPQSWQTRGPAQTPEVPA